MSNKKQYKHKFNKSQQAAYNLQNARGWECPTCGSFMRAGDDHCYSCGEMPEVDAGESDILIKIMLWTSGMFIIPLLGFLNQFADYDLSMFLVIPLLMVLTLSIIELLKIIEDVVDGRIYLADIFTIINRTWIFYFSIKAMIPIVKTLFPQLA